MAAFAAPAKSLIARALREPALLTPGRKPLGSVRPNYAVLQSDRYALWPVGNTFRDFHNGEFGANLGSNTIAPVGNANGLALDFDNTAAESSFANVARVVLQDIGAMPSGFVAVSFICDSTSSLQYIFAHSDYLSNSRLYFGVSSGALYVRLGASSNVTRGSVSAGKLTNALITWSGTTCSIFANGQKYADYTFSGTPGSTPVNGDTAVGCYYNANDSAAQGAFDGKIFQLVAGRQRLSDAEALAWTRDPYSGWESANDFPFLVPTAAAGGGITLSVANALHAHTSDQPSLTQAHVLAANEATHGHTSDQPLITQQHILAPADALHDHLADAPTLTQQHVLAVAAASHAHTADNVTLTVAGTLAVADALHGHTADQPTLTQAHVLVAADATHSHTADQSSLDLTLTLVPNDAAHAQLADSPLLTQAHLLAVQDALHAHYADSPLLPTHVTLVASDALHAHLADSAVVIVGELQTPAGTVYLVESQVRAYRVDGPVGAHLIH